jgi:hypothetical protein
MDLGTFFIDSIIVHDVPKRAADGGGDPLILSEVPSSLDQSLRNFFKERITRSLGKQAFEVEHDPANNSPVPQHVVDIIGDARKLVTSSQEAAKHLHASQSGVNPAGLVVICRGRVDGQTCCAILKLEREDAIRVEQTQLQGHRTFSVAYLRDLMLGRNTRVFKASLFVTSDGATTGLDGLVSDDQASISDGGGVAGFFLSRFLGCRLKEAPEVATRKFFEATQDWINSLGDPVKQGRYEVALIAQMNHTATTVVPRSFASSNLDTQDRNPYLQHLAAEGAPTARFAKNNRLIEPKIQQMSIRFQNSNIRVSGSPDAVQQYVQINPPSTDGASVEITDDVEEIRGGR